MDLSHDHQLPHMPEPFSHQRSTPENSPATRDSSDGALEEVLWMRGAGKGEKEKRHQTKSQRGRPVETYERDPPPPPPCDSADQVHILKCPKSFDIHAMALSFTVDPRNLYDAEVEAAGVKRPIVQGRTLGMDETPDFTAQQEFTKLWDKETKETDTMESMGRPDAAELDNLRSSLSNHVRSPLPGVPRRHNSMATGRLEGPGIYTVDHTARLAMDATTGPVVDADVSLIDDLATPCSRGNEPGLEISSSGTSFHPAEATDGYTLEHQSRRNQGNPPCISDTVDISNPPTNVNTPRLGTPETHWSEAAHLKSKPAQGGHLRQCEDDTISNVNSWTRGIFEALGDEYIPGLAERTRRSERDQEESEIRYSRVAGPKSDASDSLPDTATPSEMVDGAKFDASETGPLSNNEFADITSRPSLELPDKNLLSRDVGVPCNLIRCSSGYQDSGDVGAVTQTHTDSGRFLTPRDDDADSAFGDECSHSPRTISMTSSVMRHEWKHGRRYHSYRSVMYWFPDDDEEQERLDILHHVFLLALDGRLFLAPINPHPCRILDVGAGTGIWGIDVADLYPAASIKGLDISPMQPEFLPPNLQFVIDDAEQHWDEPTKYDYIHCRNMEGSIEDWPRLVRQMYDSLKPGGWIELQGFVNRPYSQDKSLPSSNPLAQLMDGLVKVGKKYGRSMEPAPSFKHWAESTGFVAVDERRFQLPVGYWPKDRKHKAIGAFMAASFLRGVGGLTAAPFRDVLLWSREEVEVLNAKVRDMVARRDIHAIFDFIVVIGMKPMTGH
ncbi:hypothetical protein HIM_11334 [Hirsutella minnesotensis 3608]|uniref:Methyltransferase domain-containing protein n=1 Tax=Hirsutella minnesotensis 3608 TaxID=1043627 RepID=A0A0F7ZJ47_9HYPO|nr:hypothetical protein HIM_11334 [Hirsutella minnesotensis 3608]